MRRWLVSVGMAVGLCLGACSADDHVTSELEQSGVELNGLGREVPESFPKDEVALPDLPLESAVSAAGTYVFRYTSRDAADDVEGYRRALMKGGFSIANEFDNLGEGEAGNNVGFVATSRKYSVTVAAFGPGDIDGEYMGVSVMDA